jgi:phosphatidylglycerol---prolipoprotein diacylglyceryl transferase
MQPILFKTSQLTIYSFGPLVILGILLGVLILWLLAKKLNLKLPKGKFFDYVIYVLLAGVIGSRLFYLIFHWSDFGDNLWQIITSWSGGLSFYGGLIFGLVMALLLLRKDKDKLKWLDISFISTMFGLSLGMIGCFLTGAYYGRASDLPWAVTYVQGESFAFEILNQPVHPTQLYEALIALVIGISLLFFLLSKKHKLPSGFVFLLGLFFYGIWRVFVDYFLLGKPETLGTIKIDVLISIIFIIGSILSLIFMTIKIRKNH